MCLDGSGQFPATYARREGGRLAYRSGFMHWTSVTAEGSSSIDHRNANTSKWSCPTVKRGYRGLESEVPALATRRKLRNVLGNIVGG